MSTTNRDIVIKELKAAGITNKYSIAGILSIIDKESGFKPQSEISYATTSNARIRSIFSKTNTLTDKQLDSLKTRPFDFFNFVYGGKHGNAENEGYKYRGRGFNQLTFKGNYVKYGTLIGADLVNYPDLVNRPAIAAKVVAAYFKEQFDNNKDLILKRYKAKNINDFKDAQTSVNAFYNANAGFGKDTSNVTTQGKTKALSKVDSFLNIVDANKGKIGVGLLLLVATGVYFIKNSPL